MMTADFPRISLLNLGKRSTDFYRCLLQRGSSKTVIQDVYVDFQSINAGLPNQFNVLAPQLESALDGCDARNAVLIPNITLHETLDYHCSDQYRKLNLHHPVLEAGRYMKSANIDQVTLFASQYSMESSYICDLLRISDVQVHIPKEQTRVSLDHFRVDVYNAAESQSQVAEFHAMINDYARCFPVLVACTELSLMLNYSLVTNEVIDISRLQVHRYFLPQF